jgi:hypothetical protein
MWATNTGMSTLKPKGGYPLRYEDECTSIFFQTTHGYVL